MAVVHPDHLKKHQLPYVLRLLEGNNPHTIPSGADTKYAAIASDKGVFTFPVPPKDISPIQNARIGLNATRNGVSNDEQGVSPPEWTLNIQYPFTPIQDLSAYGWQRAIEQMVVYYLEQNKKRGRERKPLLKLQFSDFYAEQHWYVVPTAVPLGQRGNVSPMAETCTLKLKGLQRAIAPVLNPQASAAEESIDTNAVPVLQGIAGGLL